MDRFLTIPEAAQYLTERTGIPISIWSVRQHIRGGKLKVFRPSPRKTRILLSELDNLLDNASK